MTLLLSFFSISFFFLLTFHFNSLIVLKPKQYARLSNEVKYKKRNHLYNVEYVVQSQFHKMKITFLRASALFLTCTEITGTNWY